MIRTLFKICALLSVLTLAACGSSGGDSSTTPSGISYTGKTTQAVLTTSNSADIADNADFATSTSFSLGSSLKSADKDGSFSLMGTTTALNQSVLSALGTNAVQSRLSQPTSGTVYGDCGGSASYSGTLGITGDVTVNMTFTNYCSYGITLNGNATFNGDYSILSGAFVSGTYTFYNLTETVLSENSTMSGTIAFTTTTVTANLVYQGPLGNLYKLENFTIVQSGSTYTCIGRIYYSEYGYVDVTTTSPITIDPATGKVVSGVILLTGNVSAVKMTYVSGVETVTLDSQLDGIFESTIS